MFESNRQLVKWIQSCLPNGSELQDVLRYADLDGDGMNEVFGMYRYHHQLYLYVLKNYGEYYWFYYPLSQKIVNRAIRALSIPTEERAVYLFPAPIKQVGGTKWGYIDAKGKFVLPAIYDEARDFQENGLSIVRSGDQSGVIDAKGYFIVKPKYDTIQPFSEGRAIVNDRHGNKVIDESGKEITERAYSVIMPEYKEGRVAASIEDEHGQYVYGYLNKRGKEVIPLIFVSTSEFKDGKAIVKTKEGTFQLIDLTGKVLNSFPYAFIGNYGQGLLTFKKTEDGKFGYIDEEGRIVIEPRFTDAEPFIDGRAIVAMSDSNQTRYGLIDQKGHFVIKPNYNNLINLGENRFAVGKEKQPEQPCIRSIYALGDSEGHILTGFIFNEITTFEEGVASVSDDQHTFFIDKSGRRVKQLPMPNGSGTLQIEKTVIKSEVDQRLQYFSQNGDLIWKQNTIIPLNKPYFVLEQRYRPNKDYLVYYPQIRGIPNQATVNATLADLAGVKPVPSHTQLESSYDGDFELSYYQKDLLVIEITGYDYVSCAAHGMPISIYAHINLKSGLIYQLKDLFKKGSPFVKVISDFIGNKIKNDDQYSYITPDDYHGIKEDQPFYMNEAGLNIYFKPYEIAAFAAGFPTFTIPFEELKSIINQNGSFWRSFH
ncbi:WG repeat-containing protein [Neobacillus rhizosphaerae]|uniref:WG repeat-containing protein n=1 Tax=Neobacillus rhizosphaerae TaxID=2880965 RepID=UPI003D27C44A